MSLSSAISNAVSAAFKATGDLKKSVIITSVINPTYNPVTDSTTGTTQTQTVEECLVGSFSQYTIATSNGSILFNDVKLIVETSKLKYDVYQDSEFEIDNVVYRLVNPANTGRSAQGIISKTGDFVRVYQLRAV